MVKTVLGCDYCGEDIYVQTFVKINVELHEACVPGTPVKRPKTKVFHFHKDCVTARETTDLICSVMEEIAQSK